MPSTDTESNTMTVDKVQTVKLWKVILHNDDFTPFQFVVAVLRQLFGKPADEALALTMQIHEEGRAVIGIYTREIAFSKVEQMMQIAEEREHPLLGTVEEA